ncbi:hypothetical protein [Sphingomonas cavernae]|uniref:Uncharacterized protein n=1 Tax=Sphingomonas cavernae TaxID=2320861 RepID=A0A418WP50_9SPHN|nr:hypothetical protein [Sphingomonas cavernae]RJF93011.1 hypothetical protein D3876_01085 [Sphingomonas cavernae]
MTDGRHFPDIEGCNVAVQLDHHKGKPGLLFTVELPNQRGKISDWFRPYKTEQEAIAGMTVLTAADVVVVAREAMNFDNEIPF